LVTVALPFLSSEDVVAGEATRLILEAYDAFPKVQNDADEKEKIVKKFGTAFEEETLQHAIPADFFPPCMKIGLQGMKDGKKDF